MEYTIIRFGQKANDATRRFVRDQLERKGFLLVDTDQGTLRLTKGGKAVKAGKRVREVFDKIPGVDIYSAESH